MEKVCVKIVKALKLMVRRVGGDEDDDWQDFFIFQFL